MEDQEILSCKIASRLLSESLERRLNLKERAALAAHLTACKVCLSCSRQVKGLRKLWPYYVKAVATFAPGPETSLSAEAKQRIKAALRAAA